MTPVFAQTDRYVSLRHNGPSDYMSDWSSKRPVATGPGPVFEFPPNPCNCNRTDHQRAWTATTVWSFFGPVQSSLQSFCSSRSGLLNTKAVSHMGWNTAECLDSPSDLLFTEGISPTLFYYFVHSYCASYDSMQNFEAVQWAHLTMQYGNKVFVSAVHKGSVFGTQFHPKKSGIAGLTILDMWIKKPWLGYVKNKEALRGTEGRLLRKGPESGIVDGESPSISLSYIDRQATNVQIHVHT